MNGHAVPQAREALHQLALRSGKLSEDGAIIPFYRSIIDGWMAESQIVVPLVVRNEGIGERLTPLEARAIRLALEYVGPMIAADAHTPLSRVRKKLEETFGRFELAGTPVPRDASAEETLVRDQNAFVESALARL